MQRCPGRRGQVGVNGGGGDAGVAEQDLHDAGVDAVLDQPCRVGMAQGMRCHPPLDACRHGGGGEGIGQHALVERRIPVSVGEYPAAVAMGAPQAAEIVENRLWQRYQPLLVALADDAQHLVGPINGADLQRGGLADAQTTRIHDGKARLVDRVADTAEEMTDLIFRQRVRQPLVPWRGDPFFPLPSYARPRLVTVRGKKGSPRHGTSGCLTRCRKIRSVISSAVSATRSTRRALPSCMRVVCASARPPRWRSAPLIGPTRCCASSARATRSGWCRCHSRFSTISAACGAPIATAAGYSPTDTGMRRSTSACCPIPSPPPPWRQASSGG